MAAYRRVYDSRHLQADCQEPGTEHTLGIRVWAIPFYSLCIELSYFLIGLSLIFICVDNECCCGFVSLYMQCESTNFTSPLRYCGNIFSTSKNFKIKFYTPIGRSYIYVK